MIGKLLTRLFALGGMSLTCVACYGVEPVDYRPDFIVSGRVVDNESRPIAGIKVSQNEYTLSADDGTFLLNGTSNVITFTDVDGEKNGGDFEPLTIQLEDSGDFQIDLGDVVLKQKNE